MNEKPNKPVQFFAKLVFICNMCFVAAAILRLIEIAKRAKENYEPAISLQPLESTIVVLGYGAIIFNVIFFIYFLYLLSARKVKHAPGTIVLINLIIFPVQVWYFFYS